MLIDEIGRLKSQVGKCKTQNQPHHRGYYSKPIDQLSDPVAVSISLKQSLRRHIDGYSTTRDGLIVFQPSELFLQCSESGSYGGVAGRRQSVVPAAGGKLG